MRTPFLFSWEFRCNRRTLETKGKLIEALKSAGTLEDFTKLGDRQELWEGQV